VTLQKIDDGFIVIGDVLVNIYSLYTINYFKWGMYVKVYFSFS